MVGWRSLVVVGDGRQSLGRGGASCGVFVFVGCRGRMKLVVWARWRLRRLERVHQMEERRKAVQGQQEGAGPRAGQSHQPPGGQALD